MCGKARPFRYVVKRRGLRPFVNFDVLPLQPANLVIAVINGRSPGEGNGIELSVTQPAWLRQALRFAEPKLYHLYNFYSDVRVKAWRSANLSQPWQDCATNSMPLPWRGGDCWKGEAFLHIGRHSREENSVFDL